MARRWRVLNRRRRRAAEIGPRRCGVCRSLDVLECRLYAWEKAHDYACSAHAVELGFCGACGLFCGGMESFDFGGFGRQRGYCDNCWDEIMSDYWSGEDDLDDMDSDFGYDAEEGDAYLWP